MRCLQAVLLLAGLAAAAPQDANAQGSASPDSMVDSPVLPNAVLANLPSNVPIDLFSSTRPPTIKREDNLRFAILHCDGVFKGEDQKIDGDCHFMAGELAKESQLHLDMIGTRTIAGPCELDGKMDFSGNPRLRVQVANQKLKNGWCVYQTTTGKINRLKLSN